MNGCETNTLTDGQNCGACGKICRFANAGGVCVNGLCGLVCNAGFDDCDKNAINGCEADLTLPQDCGGCNIACPKNARFCFMESCTGQLPGTYVGSLGLDYFKVPVVGAMTDTNVVAACVGVGLHVPCQSSGNCNLNDLTCRPSQENCNAPMLLLAQSLCGRSPDQCPALYGCFQYMGHTQPGDSSCGAKQGQWCAVGSLAKNRFALCVP